MISVFIFAFLSLQIYSQTDDSRTGDQIELERILKKSAEYCERVKSIALYYVCREEIQDKMNFFLVTDSMRISPFGSRKEKIRKDSSTDRIVTNSYVYDYQLINKDGEILEERILIEKNHMKRRKKNAELESRLKLERIVYGPVGFLSQYWQEYFDYKVIGQERVNNIMGTVVEATPRPDNVDNRNFAQIWIDKENGSILQIKWQPESIIDYVGNQIDFQAFDIEVKVEWSVTYGIEKNGVRFPDQQYIQEFLVSEDGEKFLQNEITILYNNYKFFIVEIEIKY
jgi:hypothetical protein